MWMKFMYLGVFLGRWMLEGELGDIYVDFLAFR